MERTSAEEWLEAIKMMLPLLNQMMGTGGDPLIIHTAGHASVIYKNDLGESLRFDYDDGQHCEELHGATDPA